MHGEVSASRSKVRRPSLSIGRVLRRPVGSSESIESTALLVAASVLVLGGLIALLVFWGRVSPITGTGSIGEFLAFGAAITAIVVFVLGRVMLHRGAAPLVSGAAPILRLHWLDVAALALAHGVIALLGWLGIATIVESSFIGATVFALPAAIMVGVALALTSYAVFLSAVNMSTMLLSLVLAVFLVVGVFASMLSTSDPHWWQRNLSVLGVNNGVSSFAFNFTLIVAGVIVTTIAHAATSTIPVPAASGRRRRSLALAGLALIGVLLTCVGLFPLDRFLLVHNSAATGMVVAFAVLAISMRWLLPGMPRVFLLVGYVFIAVILVVAVFFFVGYYNLTAVELVSSVLIFTWIILFLRNASAITVDAAGEDRAERD